MKRCFAALAGCALVLLAALASGQGPAAAAGASCPPAGGGVLHDAPDRGRTVALTFDDGPGRDTGRILDILANAHVEATFFNLGIWERSRPARVREEQRAGFVLGDHTWDHQDLALLDAAGQGREIDRERAEQASITGLDPCLLRPPYGSYDATTLQLARQRGMRVWNWSVDPQDWKAAGSGDAYWVSRIVTRAEAGVDQRHPAILLHNQEGGNPATVAALPRIIAFYKSRGYRFVDLDGGGGPPVVRRVTPSSAPVSGGTPTTVFGYGFRGVPTVRFGGVAGTHVHVLSGTELTVIAPRHAAGPAAVRVVTTFGTSAAGPAGAFRYLPG